MQGIAKFEKVSFDQFLKDWCQTRNLKEESADVAEAVKKIYDNIKLPKRATLGSAGYDFFLPTGLSLPAGRTSKFPTGIRVKIDRNWALFILPRSGLGFKYRMQLDNTLGLIDSDYYNSDNEGHIFIKITNDSKEDESIHLDTGEGFAQGVFMMYGVTEDDDTSAIRNGGFGSTTNK